jgi:chromosome segregation ATPase
MKEQSYVDALKGTAPTGAPTWKSARAFYLEVIRKECEQVKAELAAVREERDEYAECFEEFKDLAYDARDELAAARDELRARDEAIADSDQRARWRLEQKPYTGIGEP